MYIYTFELRLSSENYLAFSSLLKFISLSYLYDLKLWFIVFEILVTTAQKTNSLTCSYTGLKKTYVGEVTIQMLKYLLQKSFWENIFFQRLEETIQQTIHSLILFFHFFANLRVLCQTKAFKFQSFNLFSKGKMDNCLLSLIRYKKSLKEYVLFLLFNGMEKWS